MERSQTHILTRIVSMTSGYCCPSIKAQVQVMVKRSYHWLLMDNIENCVSPGKLIYLEGLFTKKVTSLELIPVVGKDGRIWELLENDNSKRLISWTRIPLYVNQTRGCVSKCPSGLRLWRNMSNREPIVNMYREINVGLVCRGTPCVICCSCQGIKNGNVITSHQLPSMAKHQ